MAAALEGIRVIDNGIVQAGTFPARILADFGAEVIRVENYVKPDISRVSVFADGLPREPWWEASGNYHEQHRNKTYCVGLDVRKAAGRELFLRMVTRADIVFDSHPPGVMERLRLGWDVIHATNPRAILMTSSGYGYGGPYSGARSFGMMTELMCGSGWLNGYPDSGPRRGRIPLTDHPATVHAAFCAMAALVHRRRTGEGVWVDISQYEVGVGAFGDAVTAAAMGEAVPGRVGSTEPSSPFSGCFRCAGDDAWITVAVTSAAGWRRLAETMGRADLAARDIGAQPLKARERDDAARSLAAWCAPREPQTVFTALAGDGIAASPVNTVRELLLDPHLEARGFFWLIDHAPEQHAGRRAFPGPAARLSETPAELRARAPMVGEHNRFVATELLGYSPEEFDRLVADGSVGTTPAAANVPPPTLAPPIRPSLGPDHPRGTKRHDPHALETLRERFGPEYGPKT